ncbi:hemerythrin domain-containing protein [Candidatus Venteria ishoeyi]|uniref:Hemerythrin-like domain-containing protein n=1 Tax=Candidatus Venteria ishoeyi TaxID=1899563 RepID=A0A1H6FE88_9GAMM|nr:hemerythrin domain-containing protein [Candidatus Venteria ishoeyi]MDM8546967.1 hemerythrin domain-containing protein [Candidatus Venteria ishoeyi]SEH07334.1 Uncharacterised protein [Candidatus Venteria ishoeyi]
MKRVPELSGLSSDHHRALVMAKKAKQAKLTGNLNISDIWHEMEAYYAAELENHFRIEETHIAPQLKLLGKTALIERLYNEHADISAYFNPTAEHTADTLKELGDLLEKHARFEERELFNIVQEIFSTEELASIEKACIK